MKPGFAACWCLLFCGFLHAAAPMLADKVEKVAMKELDVYRQCAIGAVLKPAQRQELDEAVAAAKESTHTIRLKLDAGQLTADKASEQMAGVAETLILRISTMLDTAQIRTFQQRLDAAPRIKLAQIDSRLLSAIKASLDATGLSEAQARQSELVFKGFQAEFDENYMLYLDGKLGEGAWQAKGSAMTRKLVDDCLAVLEPGQKATWALLMAGDFAAPRLRRSLDQFRLTSKQTATMDQLFDAFKENYDALRADFAARKMDAPQFKQKAQELLRDLGNDSQSVLTPQQRKAWEDAVQRAK